MKQMTHPLRMSLVFFAGVSLVACAPLFQGGQSRQAPPGTRIVQAGLKPSIGYYESAVAAVNARRYALALEYLQTARAQNPNDVRVLTAFGVVYDKLGRFDLSARFYTQAAALDPQSKIVAADLDYSRRLQGFAASDSAPRIVATAPPLAEQVQGRAIAELPQLPAATMPAARVMVASASSQRTVTRPEVAARLRAKVDASQRVKSVFLTGHPLTIVDASGQRDGGKPVRSYLSGLGWSLAKGEDPKMPTRTQTVIVYREPMIAVAKALARTLSLPMRLTVSNDVQGLQLVLGGDISATKFARKASRPLRRQLALAVTNRERQD